MDSSLELISQARQHYQANQLQQAQYLYEQVLQRQPQQLEALSVLGMLAYRRGELGQAYRYYQQLVTLQPNNADVHNNLGIILKKQGEIDQAITYYQRALTIKPNSPEYHHNLGKALAAKEEVTKATQHFRRAIALRADYGKAYVSLGELLQQQGEISQAITYLEKALTFKPNSFKLHNDIAEILKKQGNWEAAITHMHQAVEINPESAELRNNLGTNLMHQGKLAEAKEQFLTAISLKPGLGEAYINLGNVLTKQGEITTALHYLNQALRLNPNSAECHNQLGIAYKEQDKLTEAIHHYRQGIQLESASFGIHNNLGNALRELGQLEEADYHYHRALALNPNYSEAHSGLALNLLMRGDLKAGFAEYEWRWQTERLDSPAFSQPLWDGSPLIGSKILLHAEQGLGDSIQFIRYVPLVAKLGLEVILECPPLLENLFSAIEGVSQLVVKGNNLPYFDVHAPLMSLPHILDTTLDTIPNTVPYIFPSPNSPIPQLPNSPTFKIGIVWAGNPKNPTDKQRSCPLSAFRQLFSVPEATFYSLQKGVKAKDLSQVNFTNIYDLGEELNDFTDTTAIISQLDLVITVDTAVAHLTGAMGKPVWVLLSHIPDWRWLLGREDSPWYPTMRLFRQPQRGDWHRVFLEVTQALIEYIDRQKSAPSNQPTVTTEEQSSLELALQYYQTKQWNLAKEICQEILSKSPNQIDALNLLGIMAYQEEQLEEAAIYYQQVIAIQPDNAHAHNNIGILLKNQGQIDAAIENYRQALEIQPQSPEFHNNLAVALQEKGEFTLAREHCNQAITLKPNYAKAHLSLGKILLQQGEFIDASKALQKAIALNPKSIEGYNQLAVAYKQLGEFEAAISCYQRALKLKPNQPKTLNNLGNTYLRLGDWDSALPHLQQAIALKPDYGIAYHNLGKLFLEKVQLEEARKCFNQALNLNPHHGEAHFGLAFIELLQGNFPQGWQEYEWRKQLPGFSPLALPKPLWDGSSLQGKTIFLYGEQGLGDTIQFIRYAALLQDSGARVMLGCNPSLARLFASIPAIEQVIVPGDVLPHFDCHASVMSLPYLWGTTLDNIPNNVPYLSPPSPHLPISPSPHLPALKVGIVWAGNPDNERDRQRSCPFSHFLKLLEVEGVAFYSLQKGKAGEDFRKSTEELELPIIDLSEEIEDFGDTAAIISQLDLVITVDTAVAHLAGAMGKPVWVLLSYLPDWRWLLEREDSPWYPTMRLFRQSKLNDWEGVTEDVVRALGMLLSR